MNLFMVVDLIVIEEVFERLLMVRILYLVVVLYKLRVNFLSSFFLMCCLES